MCRGSHNKLLGDLLEVPPRAGPGTGWDGAPCSKDELFGMCVSPRVFNPDLKFSEVTARSGGIRSFGDMTAETNQSQFEHELLDFCPGGGNVGQKEFTWSPCGDVEEQGAEDGSDLRCKAVWPPELDISVELEKPLVWDEVKEEWRWHKTWRLPEITVRVRGTDAEHNMQVRLSTVCRGLSSSLTDVKMISCDENFSPFYAYLVDNEVRFSRLRLMGTTNNSGGKKFHLLVSLMESDGYGNSKVVASRISTPFCVYSRRDADKTRRSRHHESSAWMAFPPDMLHCQMVKKTSDRKGRTIMENIDNSWPGIIRYFQAPNIRFKTRHPLLIFLRFSSVLVIMRNSIVFPEANEEALRHLFCMCGFSVRCNLPVCCKCHPDSRNAEGGSKPLWYISIRDCHLAKPSRLKWLIDHLQFIKSPQIGLLVDPRMLPAAFVPTNDVHQIIQLYTRLYSLEHAAKGNSKKTASREETPAASPGNSPQLKGGPPAVDGLSAMAGSPQQETPNSSTDPAMLRRQLSVLSANTMELYMRHNRMNFLEDSDATTPRSSEESFEQFWLLIHDSLSKHVLNMTEYASKLVTTYSEEAVDAFRKSMFICADAYATATFAQDTVLFAELRQRVPGVCEAYQIDHLRQSEHFTEIYERLDQRLDPTETFLKVIGLGAKFKEHTDKEREHLLPYFLKSFSSQELAMLLKASQAAIDEKRISMQKTLSQGLTDGLTGTSTIQTSESQFAFEG